MLHIGRPAAAGPIAENPAALPTTWEAQRSRRIHGEGRGRALRPSLSPMLVSLACAWAAIAAANRFALDGWFGAGPSGADSGTLFAAAVAAASCLLLAVGRTVRPAFPCCALAVAGLISGSCAGWSGVSGTLARAGQVPSAKPASYRFLVDADPARSASGGWRFEAKCMLDDADVGTVWVDVTEPVLEESGIPCMGEVLRVSGAWRDICDDEFGRSLLARGICARLRASAVSRVGTQGGAVGAVRSWRAGLLQNESPRSSGERALLAGVVCGMQAALADFGVRDDFSDLGLAHLVAVSGSHLAVVAGILGSALSRSRLRPGPRCMAELAALGIYVVLTGIQASAVRSWAMVACVDASRIAGRRSHAVSSVSLAGLVLVLLEPSYAASMGFALSVLSVLGIAVFSGLAEEWLRGLPGPRLPDRLAEGVAVTVVAQAFTMPVTVPAFAGVPLLSPIANVVFGPLVSALMVAGLACVPASAALACVAPGASDVVLAPCDALGRLCCSASSLLADAPLCCVAVDAAAMPLAVALAAGSVALYAIWPAPTARRWAAAVLLPAAVVCALLVRWGLFAPARIVVLDVGQGDAILVQDGSRSLLVDTGPDDAVVLALARNHVVHLDAVLLTHTDTDHVGGLDDLARRVLVDRVAVARGVAGHVAGEDPALEDAVEAVAGASVIEVARGDTLRVGGFELDVLLPEGPVAGDENEDSVVLLARYVGAGGERLRALLTGDAEAPQIGPLASDGAIGDLDLYKAGHHGSRASIDGAVMGATTPELVVASAGEGNSYGHPSEECIEAATAAGAAFLCTIDRGDVDVRPGAGGPLVLTQK